MDAQVLSQKAHKASRVTPGRALFGASALLAWTGALMAAVMLVPHPAVAVLAGVLYTVPLISFWEFMVHVVMYHGKGLPGMKGVVRIHVAGHHHHIFPPSRYVQDGPYAFMRFRAPREPWRMSDNALDNALTQWAQIGLHFIVGVPAILGPAWLITHDVTFLLSALVTLAFVSWLLAYVHGVIHTPRDRWIEGHRWFQWLDRHHYIHHIDYQANVNFLLPLCDVLFGTLKMKLTEEEAARHPTFEQAKPMAKDIVRPAVEQAS